MQRILFLHTRFSPPNGADAVAAWMLEALKDLYDVTVLTMYPADFEALNRYFSTQIRPGEVKVQQVPSWLTWTRRLDPDPFSIQPTCGLLRAAKRIADQFDLVMTADMEMDLGRPGIQYVHYPYLIREHGCRDHRLQPSLSRQLWGLLTGRYRPWMLIAQYSFERMKQNWTFVNSDWTGEVYRQGYGVGAATLYPPVPGCFPDVAWHEKENAFACVGRWSPVKRLNEVIEIVRRLRRRHHELRLHFIGSHDRWEPPSDYYSRFKQTCQKLDWITLHEDCSRQEMVRILSRIRYGIHARREEHFGIAVAEMLKAGAIPFVHDSGGQVEIVGHRPELKFRTLDEAVVRIEAVLDSSALQQELHAFLQDRQELFGTERFVNRVRETVALALGQRAAGPVAA